MNWFKYIFFVLASSALLCLSQSCEEVKGEAEEFAVKEKTLLVYMIANNNLSGNAAGNLSDIKKGYIPEYDKGNIVVYYHVPNQAPLLLNIFKDKEGMVKTDTSYRFPARNSATKESLKSAMSVTATLFPADEYGLILWSHGTGWLPEGFYENPVEDDPAVENNTAGTAAGQLAEMKYAGIKYIEEKDPYADMIKMATASEPGAAVRSFGSDEGKEMEIGEIVEAMPYKVSFIIFDACLMGGIEVAYELKDSTDYIISSPAEILSYGFPYSKIMEHIFADQTDLEAVAREYYDFYNSQHATTRYATISLIKTSELENVANISKEIFAANREKISSLNVSSVQRYYRGQKHWFYDFNHFMKRIASEEQYLQFAEALDKAVLYKASTPYFFDITISDFSGLSTYIPIPQNSTLSTHYKTFKWNQDTGFIE